jgi:hypothetical protein
VGNGRRQGHQTQINEYHKLLEDLKAKNITLLDALVVAIVCVMIQKVFR